MILEPTTTITDYMLTVLGGYLGWRLLKQPDRQRTHLAWAGSLFAMALGAFFGGTSHGFADRLGPAAHGALWKATMWSIGLTALLLLAATAYAILATRARRVLVFVGVVQFALYVIWTIGRDDFIWVIADYLPAVLIVLALQLAAWRGGRAGADWIVAGLLTTLVGAGVQASGFTLHRHFNHNDLYHVIQMAATVMLYRGAVLARDRTD